MDVRRAAWSREGGFGAEFVQVRLGREFDSGMRWLTERLMVSVRAENFGRKLELRRLAGGGWTEVVEDERPASISLPRSPTDLAALADLAAALLARPNAW